jgi:hypothetical protein
VSKHATRRKLLKIQMKIFDSLKVDSGRLLGETPLPIQKYEREFQKDFASIRAKIQTVGKTELVNLIRSADVAFVADFHTFSQAQRTALRLIRDVATPFSPRVSRERWFIGIEFISSKHQAALDDFQAGRLSLNEFLARINYHEEWGFPWRNYAPIFDWARENGVRLIALNRPREAIWRDLEVHARTISDLKQRDEWAAGLTTDLFAEEIGAGRKPKMIVLYGELHVSTNHLPQHLRKVSKRHLGTPLKTLSVHQNHDELYWQLARAGKEHTTQAVRLKKDAVCVISSTPWTKLQSLVSWAEGGLPEDLWEEGSDERSDYLSLMRTYSQALSEFFGVAAPSFDALTLHTIDDADLMEDFAEELVKYHVVHNLRIYVPLDEVAYLGIPSHNGAAELAAAHLFRARTGVSSMVLENMDDFYRMVLEACFSFFGSLILNPKRKCDLPADHEDRLRALRRGEEPAFALEREARELTLGFLKEFADVEAVLRRRGSIPALVMCARFAGSIYGKRLHRAMINGAVPADEIKAVFLSRTRVGAFQSRYDRLLKLISATPIARTKARTI